MKKQLIFLIFAIVGLIFLVVGTIICANVFQYDDVVETTAIITDFEEYREYSAGKWRTGHKTHLTYEIDGRSYANVANMYSSSWNIGDEIEIYYDVNDPREIGSKTTDVALLALPGVGLVFFVVGGIVFLVCRKKEAGTRT